MNDKAASCMSGYIAWAQSVLDTHKQVSWPADHALLQQQWLQLMGVKHKAFVADTVARQTQTQM